MPDAYIYPLELKEQMKAASFLISTLNQDTNSVQELAKAAALYQERERQLEAAPKKQRSRQSLKH